ncbi:hypothetical protein [Fodinicola feengrottensis]|uniref:hypothetical protein n=1 Tax=Fodinicola feengrottensis TaxID=435914 RepID=UPI00244169FD|nr:hypothetical protein [Fodinicola feengrottensis]
MQCPPREADFGPVRRPGPQPPDQQPVNQCEPGFPTGAANQPVEPPLRARAEQVCQSYDGVGQFMHGEPENGVSGQRIKNDFHAFQVGAVFGQYGGAAQARDQRAVLSRR